MTVTTAPELPEHHVSALSGADPTGFLTALGLLTACEPSATLHFAGLEPVLRTSSTAEQIAARLRAITDKTHPTHDLKGADRTIVTQTPQLGAWLEFQERTWAKGRQVASWTRLVDPSKPAVVAILTKVSGPNSGPVPTVSITVPAGRTQTLTISKRRFAPDVQHPWVQFGADGTVTVTAPEQYANVMIAGVLTDLSGAAPARGQVRIQVKDERKLSGSRLWFRKSGPVSGPLPSMAAAWGDEPGSPPPKPAVMTLERVARAVSALLAGGSPQVEYDTDVMFRYCPPASPLPVNELLVAAATRCLPPADVDGRTASLKWSLWTTPMRVTSAVEILRSPDLAISAGLRRFTSTIAPLGESQKTTGFISTTEDK
ncbi:hypothetical protein [Pengzhenrongella sp.]|jgi:hypothetical protein|uniref:hypothetical protein n=1 Tax=Pengzhenrongella sp. TaxID=2888820 RepID=UPI002F942DC3